MKKIVLLISALGVHLLSANDLQSDLANLEVSLIALSNLLPPPPKIALTTILKGKIERISVLHTNYLSQKNSPKGPGLLEQLKAAIEVISKEDYKALIRAYNETVEPEDNITANELLSLDAFNAWYNAELLRPTFKEIETLYKLEKFTRIKTITTQSALDSSLKDLDLFDRYLEDAKPYIATYTDWAYEDLKKNPPTYESLKAWSTERRNEIAEQMKKAKPAKAAPIAGWKLTKEMYCKMPKGTTLTQLKDKKTTLIKLGETDITPYKESNENLIGIQTIQVFQGYVDDEWQILLKPKRFSRGDVGEIVAFKGWFDSLPAGIGWCVP